MVECQLPKLDVAGSSPVSRSIFSKAYSQGIPVCSICAPFTAATPLTRWKIAASFHNRVLR